MKKLVMIILAAAILSGCALAPASAAEEESLVSKRDAAGDYDAAEAVTLAPTDELTITEAGVYILTGTYKNVTVVVDAGEDDKVQLVLANAALTNENGPAIYVRCADKVFLTAAEGTVNTIADGAAYTLTDGETELDAAVFSKEDLTINGSGKLTINGSCKHAVVSKDDLVITAKDLTVTAVKVGLSGKDSVTLSAATVTVTAGTDGVRSDKDEDGEYGTVVAADSALTVTAGSDGVRAAGKLEIRSGTLNITASEGLEATYILISGGEVTVKASDDGINAARKSALCTPTVEISGGTVTVTMGAGDTDGVDVNGNLILSGGTVYVNGSSAFDYDGTASFTGGTVYVNGQQVTTLPNQMMGGGMGGWGNPGGMGGWGNPGGPGGRR